MGAYKDGVKESQITLKVAEKLHSKISSLAEIKSLTTRSRDINLGLKERVDFAHEHKGDIFLSIHVNSSSDHRANGVEFYFQNQLEPDEAAEFLAHQESQLNVLQNSATDSNALIRAGWSPALKTIFFDLLQQSRVQESFRLSKLLRENWNGHKKSKGNSIKQAPFHVVSQTQIPATLVELGFLTNKKDFRSLRNETYLDQIVESIYQGLIEYKDSLNKDSFRQESPPL